jgi:hypothetical protein
MNIKYGIAIIDKMVRILPLQLAAITTPFFAANIRRQSTEKSLPKIINAITEKNQSGRTFDTAIKIIPVQDKSLSAIGSISFPKSLTALYFRAKKPSKKSVMHAKMYNDMPTIFEYGTKSVR